MTDGKHAQDALENLLIFTAYFFQHMIDIFHNTLLYGIFRGSIPTNPDFVNPAGKNLEYIAGKTNDEIRDLGKLTFSINIPFEYPGIKNKYRVVSSL